MLLEHGADVGAKRDMGTGRTPFQIAPGKGYGKIVEFLSELCAK